MRCKKHSSDHTSSIGVCASCLRERLLSVIAAQFQDEAAVQAHLKSRTVPPPFSVHRRKTDPPPHHHDHQPPLIFPRSVSPYISHRKSAAAADDHSPTPNHRHSRAVSDHRFFSTPQVGPGFGVERQSKKQQQQQSSRFGLISNLFRSRSHKCRHLDPDSDPRVSVAPSYEASSSSPASSSSFSWISGWVHGGSRRREKRKQKSTMMSLFALETAATAGDEICSGALAGEERGRHYCRRYRGMSPNGEHEWDGSPSPSNYSPDETQELKTTPMWKRTPSEARTSHSRVRPSPSRSGVAAGFRFCLSPLVRVGGPNRQWSTPEINYSGEIRAPAKPHLSNAALFCANRSRKLADFGRLNHNR